MDMTTVMLTMVIIKQRNKRVALTNVEGVFQNRKQ